MSTADLLMDLDRLGIQLEASGEQLRYFPRSGLTPGMVARLKAHKAELLALLRPAAAVQPQPVPTTKPTAKPICRCGGAAWQDVPIHDGQSVRRDCAGCGRFIEFPIWYGKSTGQNGQHPVE